MGKRGNLSELMRYAGRRRYLTYSSWLLSAVSALLALAPFGADVAVARYA